MVISSDKVKAAQEQMRKFFKKNRANTHLNVVWSKESEKTLEENVLSPIGIMLVDSMKDEMKKDLSYYDKENFHSYGDESHYEQ